MIDEKKLIRELNKIHAYFDNGDIRYGVDIAINEVIKQPTVGEWIPFTEREPDQDEREAYGCDMMLDCELPDEDEEILVTYANGTVGLDCFMRDGYDCYLNSGAKFITEAVAWQSLPEPYRINKTN